MVSKASLFNKTLFKKDLKLVWWLAAYVAIILFFDLPMSNVRFMNELKNSNLVYYDYESMYNYAAYTIQRPLDRDSIMQIIFLIAFPVLMASLLVGEERRKKTLDLLSVMPYTRAQIYLNKVLAAMTALITPYAFTALATLVMRAGIEEVQKLYGLQDIFVWFWLSIVPVLLFFSFTFLMGMLVGTTIAQIILTGIFMIFPFGFWGLIMMNLQIIYRTRPMYLTLSHMEKYIRYITLPFYIKPESFYYGYGSGSVSFLFGNSSSSVYTMRLTVILLVVSILMLLFAKVLFDRNKMERNGEILMFGNLETFFKTGVAVCTMLLIGPLISYMMDNNTFSLLVGYVAGASAGWFIPHYIIQINRAKV